MNKIHPFTTNPQSAPPSAGYTSKKELRLGTGLLFKDRYGKSHVLNFYNLNPTNTTRLNELRDSVLKIKTWGELKKSVSDKMNLINFDVIVCGNGKGLKIEEDDETSLIYILDKYNVDIDSQFVVSRKAEKTDDLTL